VKAKVHRTWPCGMQESAEVNSGPFVSVDLTDRTDDKPRACPFHGFNYELCVRTR
jgi:hypothetical protein